MAKTNRLISFSIPKLFDLFDIALFFYFFTLHADQLTFLLGNYNFRLNNFIAVILSIIFFMRIRPCTLDYRLVLSLGSIALAIGLSCFFSSFPKRCLFFLVWYLFTAWNYVLFPYLLIKKLDENKIFRIYLYSFVCVGLYAFFQMVLGLVGIIDPFVTQIIGEKSVRPNAFAYEPSYYALYMTPFIVMVNFHFLNQSKTPFFFPLDLKKVLGLNLLFLLSTSTSVFFAYCFFFLFVGIYGIWTKKKELLKKTGQSLLIALGSLVGACLIIPFYMKQFFLKFFYFGLLTHVSFNERWNGICNSWKIFKEHVLLGVGLGALPSHFYEVWQSGDSRFHFFLTPDFYLFDPQNPLKFFEPTCVLLETLASLGILGTSALMVFILMIFSRIRKSASIYALHFAFSLAVMLIILQFNQGLFRTYIWVQLALVYAYAEKTPRKTTEWSLRDPHPKVLT